MNRLTDGRTQAPGDLNQVHEGLARPGEAQNRPRKAQNGPWRPGKALVRPGKAQVRPWGGGLRETFLQEREKIADEAVE